MKKSDLTRSIQVSFGNMRPTDAISILDSVINDMITSIENNNKIEIRGFGTFLPRTHATKSGFNPITKQIVKLPANRTVLFRPSKELTKKMNG